MRPDKNKPWTSEEPTGPEDGEPMRDDGTCGRPADPCRPHGVCQRGRCAPPPAPKQSPPPSPETAPSRGALSSHLAGPAKELGGPAAPPPRVS